MRKFLILTYLIFITSAASAIDYVFTGNGAWNNSANWQNGLMPPGSLSAGNTITITGTAINGSCFTWPNCAFALDFLGGNGGTITIAAGGSLDMRVGTQFSNSGNIIVNGTLNNYSEFEAYSTGFVTINNGGVFNHKANWIGNQGTITINNGGTFNNESTLTSPYNVLGNLIINVGGILNNSGTLNSSRITGGGSVGNSSTISGNPVFDVNITNNGTLAPGTSPGLVTINGNYTATSTSVHNFEVGGTATNQFDRLLVSGNVTLGGALNVSLINSFVPSSNHDLTIITGTISGTFATTNLPANYSVIYNTNSVVLRRFAAPLPVNFISFAGNKSNSGVFLKWRVDGEINVSHYEVEKASALGLFTKIGQLAANGSAEYRFTDPQQITKSFYRIKSVDIDGKHSYSVVVLINDGLSTTVLKAFQTPAKNLLIVQHEAANKSSLINIYTIDGRFVKAIVLKEKTQQTTIDITSLNAGSYLLVYKSDIEKMDVLRFVKQ